MICNSIEELEKWKREKPRLFSVARLPRAERAPLNRKRWLLYVRKPKTALLYVGGWRICWRRPATLASLWHRARSTGWRAGWLDGYTTACRMLGDLTAEPKEIPEPPSEEGEPPAESPAKGNPLPTRGSPALSPAEPMLRRIEGKETIDEH